MPEPTLPRSGVASGTRPETKIAAAALLLFLTLGQAGAAGLVPDGATATGVALDRSGKATVSIAPAVAGVSHNTYTHFNVSRAGADFVNTGVGARFIVNEVTSANPSLLSGPVAVVGTRANLIIANPNGITVDGASFQNVGNLALSTGRISFFDFTPLPGVSRRDAVLNTSQGSIEIGAGGLSGVFNHLELIAKAIRVGGPVINGFTSANAGIRAVVGDSRAQFDTSVSPLDVTTPWVNYTSPATANAGAVLLDITALGSLSSGRIDVLVTDQGAGVRHAGGLFATVGDFTLSASGEVKLSGGGITARRDLIIDAPSFAMASREEAASQLASARSLEIRARRISLQGGTVAAGTATQDGDLTLGAVGIPAAGTIDLASLETSERPLTLTASGGIGIFATGQTVRIDGANLSARQDFVISADRIVLGTQWRGSSSRPATLESTRGAVDLTATGEILSTGADVRGAQAVRTSARSLTLEPARGAGGLVKSHWESAAGSIALDIADAVTITASDLRALANLTSRSGSFTLTYDAQANAAASAVATQGALTIAATGDIANIGSLIQGAQRSAADPTSLGAVTLAAGGRVLNESGGTQAIAAIFGLADDVSIDAGALTNRAGRIVSNRDLTITASGEVQNLIDKASGSGNGTRAEYSSRSRNWLGIPTKKSGFSIDYGDLAIPGQLAFLVADGAIDIRAGKLVNRGGEIDANGGSVRIRAADSVSNEALLTGRVQFERRCLILCRSSASSDVQLWGGVINANGNVSLSAGTEIANIGGRILALEAMSLNAPRVTATGVPAYSALTREGGLKSWFGDTWARIYAADQGGSFTANRGKLTIVGAAYIEGGALTASEGVEASGGIVTIRSPRRDPVTLEDHLGLTSWLWK